MVFTDGRTPTLTEVQPGQPIPLEPPPQGGYVLYVAARVRNLLGCVEFRGRLVDPATGKELGFDARSATLERHADGWGWPNASSLSNVSNVNGCPAYDRGIHGQRLDLEVTVVDRQRRQVTVRHPVVPTCMHAGPTLQRDCICTCEKGYYLGKCNFGPDAGAP